METNVLCSRISSFLLMGFFSIVLGTIALSSAFIATLATVVFLGILLAATGISHLIHAFWSAEWKGFFGQLALGILASVVGWALISQPGAGAVSITLLMAIFFMVAGLFKIAAALIYQEGQWGWGLANGLISLLLGTLVFAQWPTGSFWILGLFLGIDLIFNGWANVMLGITLRRECSLPHPEA